MKSAWYYFLAAGIATFVSLSSPSLAQVPTERQAAIPPPQSVETNPDMQAVPSVLSQNPPQGWEVIYPLAVTTLSNFDQSRVVSSDLKYLLAEYHLTGAATETFGRGQRRVMVRVYRFSDPYSAYGAYTVLRKGASTVILRGDASSEDDQNISFLQGSFLTLISTTASYDDEAKEMMRLLADKISGAILEHGDPRQFTYSLPVLDRVKGSEKVVMGPIAGRFAMPIPYISFLGLEKSQGALCADYQTQYPRPQRLKLMIAQYIDAQLAQHIYQSYIPNLGDRRRVKDGQFRDMFHMNDQYLLYQLKGKQIIVISGAHDREGAAMLASQLMRRQSQ